MQGICGIVMGVGMRKIIYHELHHPGSMCLFRLFLLSCNPVN